MTLKWKYYFRPEGYLLLLIAKPETSKHLIDDLASTRKQLLHNSTVIYSPYAQHQEQGKKARLHSSVDS